MSDQYNLTTTAAALAPRRRTSPSVQRYNPWALGIYFSFALGAPILSAALGYLIIDAAGYGWWGVWLGLVPVPTSVVVFRWAWRALRVELDRLEVEHDELYPEPPVSSAGETPQPAERPQHLRLGVKVNGEWKSPADQMHPELMALRAKCLRLVRAGLPAENWSRSALAEGPNAVMTGPDWDEASAELQHLDLFVVKPGKGGGLKPNPARDLAESIRRLEVAR